MPLPLVPIVGGAAALWLLGKIKGGKGGAGGPASSPTGGKITPASPDTDVSGDVQDSEVDCLLSDLWCYRDGQVGNCPVETDFFRQLWLPASRVKLSAITPYQWRLASYLLNGSLHRRQDLEQLYIDYQKDLRDQQAAEEGNAIFAQVASIIPVLGGIISTAVTTAVVKPLSSQLAVEASDLAASFQSLRVSVDPKNLDPPAQMLISPVAIQGDANWDLSVAPWIPRGGVSPVIPKIGLNRNFKMPDQYVGTVRGNVTGKWHAQRRLWACFQYGFMLPWVSDELLGPTLKDTVNIRARVYKAVATLSAMAFPDSDRMQRNNGLYYYHAGVGVDIYGSIFPPTDEDKPLTTAIAYEGGVNNAGRAGGVVLNPGTFTPGTVPDYGSSTATQGNGENMNSDALSVTQIAHSTGLTISPSGTIGTTPTETTADQIKRAQRAM